MGFGLEVLIPAAISAASTIGGAVMQNRAANSAGQDALRAAEARNQQLQEYRTRMKAISEEAQNANLKARDQFTDEEAGKRETEETQKLQTQYDQAVAPTPSQGAIPLGGSAPAVVGDTIKKEADEGNAYTKMLSQKLAALGTQPQALLKSGIGIQRAGNTIDTASNFGKQETALLPQYQDFASTYYRLKPQGGSQAGQALTGLGGVFAKMAGSNWSG